MLAKYISSVMLYIRCPLIFNFIKYAALAIKSITGGNILF